MSNQAVHTVNPEFTRLPPAPHVLIRLIDLCHKPDVSIDELDHIIKMDPALCAKVITISNSAAYGQLNDRHDLRQILLVLGIDTIKSIALTSAVQQFFSLFSQQLGESLGCLWLDAMICANLSHKLAQNQDYPYPDEAHLSGLLHQFGMLVFLLEDSDEYRRLLSAASDTQTLMQQEQHRYGQHNADLAADIIDSWRINAYIADATRYQHQPPELLKDTHPLIRLVNLASRLSNRLNRLDAETRVEDLYFGLADKDMQQLLEQATHEAVSEARALGIEVDQSDTIPRASIDDEAIRIELARKIRQIALLEGVHQHMSDPGEMTHSLQLIRQNLQLLFGLSSMIFFQPDNELNRLTARPGPQPPGHSFNIQLERNRSLVAEAALSGDITISSHQHNFTALTIIDRQIAATLGSAEFICIPLFKGQALVGVIATGCNRVQAEQLHQDDELLKHFSTLIADSLTRQSQLKREYEQQLQQKQLEIDLQTRHIIHEVNNPLTVINNYLEIMSIDMDEKSQNRQHLETIKSEVDRVSEILLQLKDEQSQSLDEHKRIDINKLIHKLIEIFTPTFYKQNHIKSVLEFDPSMPKISTDQNKLKQIITNLVKNAVEALTDQGVITIRTRALVIVNKEQFIEITVSDNGPGIAAGMLNNLFSPVDSNKGQHHSGLGLAIVHKLVSELQGSISYATSSSGGAEFNLLLPRIRG